MIQLIHKVPLTDWHIIFLSDLWWNEIAKNGECFQMSNVLQLGLASFIYLLWCRGGRREVRTWEHKKPGQFRIGTCPVCLFYSLLYKSSWVPGWRREVRTWENKKPWQFRIGTQPVCLFYSLLYKSSWVPGWREGGENLRAQEARAVQDRDTPFHRALSWWPHFYCHFLLRRLRILRENWGGDEYVIT